MEKMVNSELNMGGLKVNRMEQMVRSEQMFKGIKSELAEIWLRVN